MANPLNPHQTDSSALSGSGQALMVFAKAPVEGAVKTRLAADIGTKAATKLYQAFVADLLGMLSNTAYPIQIHFSPPDAGLQMTEWLGAGYKLVPQAGSDLGERMAAAFAWAFSTNIKRAVLIGTDSPDLPESFIHEAFNALATHDAVMGPSHDGGYFLVGFTRQGFLPAAFRGVHWGTPAVFSETHQIFVQNDMPVRYLREWWDIDTHDDLIEFVRRQKTTPENTAPATTRLLHKLGLTRD